MQASVLPPRFRVLSGSGLKLVAIITMLIDHSAICCKPLLGKYLFTLFSIRFTPYILLRGVGRIAFPIFCFQLTEGFRHTRSRARYLLSLLVFALISEPFYRLFNTGTLQHDHMNVFFTLALGFLGIWALSEFKNRPFVMSLAVLGLGVVSMQLKADYGWKGYLLILMTYALAEQPLLQMFAGVTLLGWPGGVVFAYPFMNLYNGQRGFVRSPVLKYAFYVFYPAHLCVLWLIHRHFFGY